MCRKQIRIPDKDGYTTGYEVIQIMQDTINYGDNFRYQKRIVYRV